MFSQWVRNAENILAGDDRSETIISTIFSVLNYVVEYDWCEAGHAVSAVLHVMLKEQGIDCELCMGEVGAIINNKPVCFDHAWIQIDDFIYDVSIYNTISKESKFPITFKSFNIETMYPTSLYYGVDNRKLDDIAIKAIQPPFIEYMSNFPGHPRGLWGIVRRISRNMGLDINLKSDDQIKYKDTKWIYVKK